MTEEEFIQKIMDNTDFTKEEINYLVKEKKEELKGLISSEGALFLIMKELGID